MNANAFDVLFKIYDIVKSWLEYSEKKNVILFTVVGIELAVLKYISVSLSSNYLEIPMIIISCAFLIALLSFYPKSKRYPFTKIKKPSSEDKNINVIFYGDIKNINLEKYMELLRTKYDLDPRENKLLEDICDQIVILSKIAYAKIKFFKYSVSFAIIGQFALVISMIMNRS